MKILKNILALILLLSMIISMVSCHKETPNETNDNEYTVTVKNPLGKSLAGVRLLIHEDGGADFNVCMEPLTTDIDGTVTLTLDPSKSYSIGLMGYPDAYVAKSGNSRAERYAVDSKNVEIVLDINEYYAPSRYDLGDFMPNFTLTDYSANTYNLYDILTDKKAVVLNFWYKECTWCIKEFPALNSAYNSYKIDLEVLAINDYDYSISGYESVIGVKLDMPVIGAKNDPVISASHFGQTTWPTTVVIDRYGVVSFVHSGAITSESDWGKLFEYFISDSYSGAPVNDINDIL